MTEKEMKDNFNEEEIKAIMFGYRIQSYIEEIVSLENWGIDLENDPTYKRQIKDIDLVYNTYQKALKLFPQDERVEEWEKMIERIEVIIYKNKNK